MACCAIGPCDASKEQGGRGCRLCDVIVKLPQLTFKDRAMLGDNEPVAAKAQPLRLVWRKPTTGSLL